MTQSEKTPVKPLCLRKDEATAAIIDAINTVASEYELSFSILDDILFRVCAEVREGAVSEVRKARESYMTLMSEWDKNNAQNEKNENKEAVTDA